MPHGKETDEGMKRKTRRSAVLALLCLVAASAIAFWLTQTPRIASIDPIAFTPGEPVTIRGRNFGAERGKGKVLLDLSPLTQSSYISWSDKAIVLRIPPSVDSGLLQVSRSFGTSDAEILINALRLPEKPNNPVQTAAGPSILSISPPEAAIGSLVEIRGINFGSNVQFSEVRFSRNAAGMETEIGGADSPDPAGELAPAFIAPEDPELMYETWDDKSIAVRVPEGAGSGTVVVRTPQGESAPFTFKVKSGSGMKYLFDKAVYSIQFKVRVRKQLLKSSGTILLYMPNPPDSFSQDLESFQEEAPTPFMGRYGQTAVFRIADFLGSETFVTRTALIAVHGVETDLTAYKDSFTDNQVPAFLRAFLAEDILVPSGAKELQALAAKVTGKEKNLQRKAGLLNNWLAKSIAWKPKPGARETPLSAFRSGSAGSRSYALLACALLRAAGVPAVPVSGFLVRRDGLSIPHYWLEYYLPATGWIPWDPVLALGSKPLGFDAGLDEPAHYFGSLDNRHIAISRGIADIVPLLGGPDLETDKASWAFQTVFEESKGRPFRTDWQEIEILGSY